MCDILSLIYPCTSVVTMTGYMRLLLLCLVSLATVTAAPRTKRTIPCMYAGELAHTLFIDELVPSLLPDIDVQELFTDVLHFDYDNMTFTRALCRLIDVKDVETATIRLFATPDQLMLKAFQLFYDYFVITLRYAKKWMIYRQEKYQNSPTDDLDLLRAIEATNITSLDPEGVSWMINTVGLSEVGLPDPEPPSTQPIGDQCREITQKILQLVVRMVAGGDKPIAYYREWLYNMTGLYVTENDQDHEELEYQICWFLVSSPELRYLFSYLYYDGIISSMVSHQYTESAEYLKRKYLAGNSDVEVNEKVRELVGLLDDMGLLDLQLMTEMYPYPAEHWWSIDA